MEEEEEGAAREAARGEGEGLTRTPCLGTVTTRPQTPTCQGEGGSSSTRGALGVEEEEETRVTTCLVSRS